MRRTDGHVMSVLMIAGTLALIGPAAKAMEDQGEKPKDTKSVVLCPIMGEPVNLSVYTATDDGPVFFCCGMCIGKYEKEPAKYADKVADQRKALADRAKVQTVCPVSGKPVVKDASIEQDGKTVHFCCQHCLAKYKQDPAKYAAALANSYTYQTKCPVSGEPIDPATASELPTGETVYYCCSKCNTTFLTDPEKYAPNLEAQGFVLNLKKLKQLLEEEGEGEEKEE